MRNPVLECPSDDHLHSTQSKSCTCVNQRKLGAKDALLRVVVLVGGVGASGRFAARSMVVSDGGDKVTGLLRIANIS